MNRIILVGNGFDLAKGLNSRYSDFISWLWKRIIKDFNTRRSMIFDNQFVYIETALSLIEKPEIDSYQTFAKALTEANFSITFKNDFLRIISQKSLLNWVDIEEEYFLELKNILQSIPITQPPKDINKLNKDFEQIKTELRKYLKNELDNLDLKIFNFESVGKDINLLDLTSKGIEELEKEYFSKFDEENQKKDFLAKKRNLRGDTYDYCSTQIYPESLLFLNFNYTNIISKFIDTISFHSWKLDAWAKSEMENINIHGELKDTKNSIIFGYGDENDELHYKIEQNGGDYLTNIKTINYLKTPNYKKVLNYIEMGPYQVFIWGHSCGLSDKTLLKTIFEHNNCISIKPFYYINEDGYNNYDDIVKNIYRTFSDKALMRDKVVNLKYCNQLNV